MNETPKRIKMVIIGNSGVGKSTIMSQFFNEGFQKKQESTIGAAFMAKHLSVDGKTVKLQLWDTSGQEKFRALVPLYYRGSDCCIMVFDITNLASFESLDGWRKEFLSNAASDEKKTVSLVLLGNKLDKQDHRKVSTEQAQAWCEEHGNIPYFEVSAKDCVMLEEAFYVAAMNGANKDSKPEEFIIFFTILKVTKIARKASFCSIVCLKNKEPTRSVIVKPVNL